MLVDSILVKIYIYMHTSIVIYICIYICAHGVMVIAIGNGHSDMSSNPGREWLPFTWEKYESNYSPSSYG